MFVLHKVPALATPLEPDELDASGLDDVLDFIQASFNIVPMEAVVQGISNGSLPSRAACLTFDDGYPDWCDTVVPALVSRGIPGTLFITTGQLDGQPIWNERISAAIRLTEVERIDLSHPALTPLPVRSTEERIAATRILTRFMKYMTLKARHAMLDRLEEIAGVRAPQSACLTQQQLRWIRSQGVEIGLHTVNHPILAYCGDAEAREEIGADRERIQGLIGAPVRYFAYPNGKPFADFGERDVQLVRDAGYTAAVTTHWRFVEQSTPLYRLPRFSPWNRASLRTLLQLARARNERDQTAMRARK